MRRGFRPLSLHCTETEYIVDYQTYHSIIRSPRRGNIVEPRIDGVLYEEATLLIIGYINGYQYMGTCNIPQPAEIDHTNCHAIVVYLAVFSWCDEELKPTRIYQADKNLFVGAIMKLLQMVRTLSSGFPTGREDSRLLRVDGFDHMCAAKLQEICGSRLLIGRGRLTLCNIFRYGVSIINKN